jgi:hypothetical protein
LCRFGLLRAGPTSHRAPPSMLPPQRPQGQRLVSMEAVSGVRGGSESRVAFSCCGCGRFRGYSGVDCCCLGGGRRRSLVRVPFQ